MAKIYTRALATRVLAVAKYEPKYHEWVAYIDAVPGKNHEEEKNDVLKNGTKMWEEMAYTLFPFMQDEDCYYRP